MFGYGALCRGLLSGRCELIRLSVAIYSVPTQSLSGPGCPIFVRRAKTDQLARQRWQALSTGDPLDA
jgi:hypothetical protein